MWMTVDQHIIYPSKGFNSNLLVIMVKLKQMWFLKNLNVKGSFNVVMVNTTLHFTHTTNERHILHIWVEKDCRSPCMLILTNNSPCQVCGIHNVLTSSVVEWCPYIWWETGSEVEAVETFGAGEQTNTPIIPTRQKSYEKTMYKQQV